MKLTDYVIALTGLSSDVLFQGLSRAVAFDTNPDGSPTLAVWNAAVTGKPRPSDQDLATALLTPAPLDPIKAQLKGAVDAAAEALRLTLITPGSGQAMEYQEAYAEAVQVDAALKVNASATFDPAAFPMLSASLGYDLDPTTGKATVDIPGEARAVLAAYDAYQKAGAAIRAARLKAKAAIEAATDEAAARAAFAAIVWPALG